MGAFPLGGLTCFAADEGDGRSDQKRQDVVATLVSFDVPRRLAYTQLTSKCILSSDSWSC